MAHTRKARVKNVKLRVANNHNAVIRILDDRFDHLSKSAQAWHFLIRKTITKSQTMDQQQNQ
jgi:hypothetical protein